MERRTRCKLPSRPPLPSPVGIVVGFARNPDRIRGVPNVDRKMLSSAIHEHCLIRAAEAMTSKLTKLTLSSALTSLSILLGASGQAACLDARGQVQVLGAGGPNRVYTILAPRLEILGQHAHGPITIAEDSACLTVT